MKTQFIPIDYDYFDFNGRNIVRVVGRNENGTAKISKVNFRSIFFSYIPIDVLVFNFV